MLAEGRVHAMLSSVGDIRIHVLEPTTPFLSLAAHYDESIRMHNIKYIRLPLTHCVSSRTF